MLTSLDMEIKRQHKHVDTTGLCYLPYLSQWRGVQSNLVGLVSELIRVFSIEPPVFSKPKNHVPPPPYPNEFSNGNRPSPIPSYNGSASSLPYPKNPIPEPQRDYPPANSSSSSGSSSASISSDPSPDLKSMVTEKIRQNLSFVSTRANDSLHNSQITQQHLSRNAEILEQAVQSYQMELVRLCPV